MFRLNILALFTFSTSLFAQSSLSPHAGDKNISPLEQDINKGMGEKTYPSIDIQKTRPVTKEDELTDSINAVANDVDPSTMQATQTPAEVVPQEPASTEIVETPKPIENQPVEKRHKKNDYAQYSNSQVQPPVETVFVESSGLTVFTQNMNEIEQNSVVIPALSTSFATIKFGEEITASQGDWVVAELDYAFLGPNGSVVELNGCRVDIDAKANFHTSSVKGALRKIVCRAPNGRIFTQQIEGKIVSAQSEYGGVKSDIIMAGPAKGLALEAINSAIKAYGQAMSFSETTSEAIASERTSEKVTNVTGDKNKYIQGKVLESSGDFMNYLITFYKGLEPTLALAPGTKIHAVIRNEIRIPQEFFKQKLNLKDIKKELVN